MGLCVSGVGAGGGGGCSTVKHRVADPSACLMVAYEAGLPCGLLTFVIETSNVCSWLVTGECTEITEV
jgi:hypothetical protein